MSNCNCSGKPHPNETCLLCCNKHLSAALALSNEYIKDDINLLRAASQIKLAAWHFDKNFNNLRLKCEDIIDKILNLNHFQNDLKILIENTLQLINENKNIKFPYYKTDINSLNGVTESYKEGMLCVSNAIELYNYEYGYEEINKSYVLGQMILASWHFKASYPNYSLKCHMIYNKINSDKFIMNELIEFRNLLWKKFKIENCISSPILL